MCGQKCSKRHGSTVPGPLEANRRLTKRRMGGQVVSSRQPAQLGDFGAMFRYGGGSIGSGSLSSRGQPIEEWELNWEAPMPLGRTFENQTKVEPHTRKDFRQDNLLPLWLRDFEKFREEKHVSFIDEITTNLSDSVKKIRNMADLRSLWSDQQYDSIRQERKVQIIFEQLMRQSSKSLILRILKDDKLGSSVSRNIGDVIQTYCHKGIEHEQSKLLQSVVQTAFLQNSIPVDQAKKILLNLEKIFTQVADSLQERQGLLAGVQYQLWKGIEKGASLRNVRPSPEICQIFLQSLQKPTKNLLPVRLRCEVLLSQCHSEHKLSGSESLSDLIAVMALEHQPRSEMSGAIDAQNLSCDYLIDILDSLPKEVASKIIIDVTERLICASCAVVETSYCGENSLNKSVTTVGHTIKCWLANVRSCMYYEDKSASSNENCRGIYRQIFNRVSLSAMSSQLQAEKSDLTIAQIIFDNRVPSILTRSRERPHDFGESFRQAQKTFHDKIAAIPSNEESSIIPYVLISCAIASRELPRQGVEEEIMQYILKVKGCKSLLSYIDAMKERGIFPHPDTLATIVSNLFDNDIETVMKTTFLHDYMPLSRFPDFAVKLIKHEAASPQRIFRLLERFVGSKTQPFVNGEQSTAILPPPVRKLPFGSVDLLHRLATAFAHSQRLHPGCAFRAVYQCYRYLCDRFAPVGPALSKAFVHAGATRFLQEGRWVSTVKLRWILGVVKKAEGAEMAKQVDRAVWQWRGKVLAQMRVRAVERRRASHKERRRRYLS